MYLEYIYDSEQAKKRIKMILFKLWRNWKDLDPFIKDHEEIKKKVKIVWAITSSLEEEEDCKKIFFKKRDLIKISAHFGKLKGLTGSQIPTKYKPRTYDQNYRSEVVNDFWDNYRKLPGEIKKSKFGVRYYQDFSRYSIATEGKKPSTTFHRNIDHMVEMKNELEYILSIVETRGINDRYIVNLR